MKNCVLFCLALFCAFPALGQSPEYTVAEKGFDHQVMQCVTWKTNLLNEVQAVTNSYVALATGMNRVEANGQLIACDPVIQPFAPNGAVAQQTRHQILFSATVGDPNGTADLQSTDQKRFISRPLLISFYDVASDRSVALAELAVETEGQLFPPDTVVYPGAFSEPDLLADLEFRNTLAGMEQFLVFRTQIGATPEDYGLNSATTYLQLLTEFFDPPVPVKRTLLRDGMNDDRVLDFGAMKIPPGKSFLAGDESKAVSVSKQWTKLEGRDFLIEQIPYTKIVGFLNTLPPPPQANNGKRDKVRRTASVKRQLPELAKATTMPRAMEVVKAPRKREGFVLDYSIVQSATDFTFKGDTTYYITNVVNLDGTTTFEGGTVIKYTNFAISLIGGPTKFLTSEYRPAIFTSKDDDSVGDTIVGSTGNPWTNFYGGGAYFTLINASSNDVKHVRISHASNGIEFDSAPYHNSMRHVQFVHCLWGFDLLSTTNYLRNVLMFDVRTNFVGADTGNTAIHAEHLTINKSSRFVDGTYPVGLLRFTNTLFVAVPTNGSEFANATSSNFIWLTNDPGIFQTAGAADHYLTNGSPYRDVGTTIVNFSLLSELKFKTTYPPIVFQHGVFTNSVTLVPSVERDTSLPDLGYHYDSVDYAMGEVSITNATIDVFPGTVIATYVTNANSFGFAVLEGATFNCEGTPTNLNRIVRYNTVQEQANTNWTVRGASVATPSSNATPVPSSKYRFTQFSTLANDTKHFEGKAGVDISIGLVDCQFGGGTFRTERPTVNFTNCLFDRVVIDLYGQNHAISPTFYNNLLFGGELKITKTSGTWTFYDNLFDKTTNTQSGTVTHNYNGYISGYGVLNGANGPNDVTLGSSPAYETSSLGRFYYPSGLSLINAGSRNATNAGLYHFTTTANQTKEATSQVDIGFHYVATSNGAPIDTDGDGLADYFEDANGNGTKESSESDWNDMDGDTDGDGISDYLEWLQGGSLTISGRTADSGNLINLRVYTPLK
jgi:hypothetical protein